MSGHLEKTAMDYLVKVLKMKIPKEEVTSVVIRAFEMVRCL